MILAPDTTRDIVAAVALVNTNARGVETLTDVGALNVFLDKHGHTGRRDGTDAELAQVQAVRRQIRAGWEAPGAAAVAGWEAPGAAAVAGWEAPGAAVVELANRLLRDAQARPWLIDHDGWGWHLHVTSLEAPLAQRLAAEAGMAFADLIRAGELDRLRICDAEGCDAVLVDLTRNHSRRYCDTGNCGNRQHVAAYRARRRGEPA